MASLNLNHLLDRLLEQITELAAANGCSVEQQAIKLLVESKRGSQWTKDILNWQGVDQAISFESYRDELITPAEKELF